MTRGCFDQLRHEKSKVKESEHLLHSFSCRITYVYSLVQPWVVSNQHYPSGEDLQCSYSMDEIKLDLASTT